MPESNADGGGRFINADQWDGYQPARDRVYAVLEGDASTPAVGNVVVLSGDAHSSWAADLSQDPNNDDAATGGYDPDTGAGSRAVEFVGTSVTSPSIVDTSGLAESALRFINPHFKYIDLTRRGYLLLDADATRVVGEWWYVDTVDEPEQRAVVRHRIPGAGRHQSTLARGADQPADRAAGAGALDEAPTLTCVRCPPRGPLQRTGKSRIRASTLVGSASCVPLDASARWITEMQSSPVALRSPVGAARLTGPLRGTTVVACRHP